jgi:hypothetical protein
MKLCANCGGVFPLEEFAAPAGGRRRSRCIACTRVDNQRRNEKRRLHGRKSDWWQQFKRAYLGAQCDRCGSTAQLQLHYKPGGVHTANPELYETLCIHCHGSVDAARAHHRH